MYFLICNLNLNIVGFAAWDPATTQEPTTSYPRDIEPKQWSTFRLSLTHGSFSIPAEWIKFLPVK